MAEGFSLYVILRNIPIVLVIFTFSISHGSHTTSLYTKDDPLWELSSSNFSDIILRKENAWIVEFYNSWCGHCIRFAPVWKAFARDIQGWKKVIKVAVVNCADDINVKLCRNYSVDSYPTIKLFKVYANEADKGKEVTEGRTSSALQIQIIDFLDPYYKESVPKHWPNLRPVQADCITDLFKGKSQEDRIALIVESPDSYLGRKVILDTSTSSKSHLQRALSTNEPLMSELKTKVDMSFLPVLLLVTEDLVTTLASSTSDEDVARKRFNEALNRHLLGNTNNVFKSTVSSEGEPQSSPKRNTIFIDKVYLVDLENALHYSLKQEIGVHSVLEGEKYSALKEYMNTLVEFFPGSPHTIRFLIKLNEYIQQQPETLNVEHMLKEMDKIQTSDTYLADMKEWVGCEGSNPRYRGYPCSLWTLFHTLTVQALQKFQEGERIRGYGKNPHIVLFAIRNYVKHFFTCEECSKNFKKMAVTMNEELQHPNDTVLWLWKAHNKANKRLAGDITEDPVHPKVQFPPPDLCSSCHLEVISKSAFINPHWNTNAVLRYLMHFYSKKNIVGLNKVHSNVERRSISTSESKMPTFRLKENELAEIKLIPASEELNEQRDTRKRHVISISNLSYSESWTFRYFTGTDMSLCISLYILSGLLLVVLYFIFITKRRKRKIQYIRMPFMYP